MILIVIGFFLGVSFSALVLITVSVLQDINDPQVPESLDKFWD